MEEYVNIKIKDIQGEDCLVDKGFLDSVKTQGILVPVALEKTDTGYRLIDGRRRLAAARAVELETVPARIMTPENMEGDLLGVLLNIHRSPNLAFEVEALKRLISSGYTQEEIAAALLTTRTRLKKHFRLLALCEEGLRALEEGRLKASAALALSRLPRKEQREILAEHEDGKITLKDVEASWRNFRLDEASLELPELETETESESEISGGLRSDSELARDFEILVSKMTSSRPAPLEVLDAVEVLRGYLKETFSGLVEPSVKTVA